MIHPTKHIPVDQTLLGAGALIFSPTCLNPVP